MPVKGKYIPNYEEMQKFMLSPQARQPCIEAARDIVADLKVTVTRSNRERSDDGVGHLADSYEVNENSTPVTLGDAPRAGADVISDHPAAIPEEFGGRRNRPRRWLGKAGAKYHVPMGGKAL